MYKHQTYLLPQTLFQVILSNLIHKYPTRNAEDYSIHKANKIFSDRSIQITGPSLWNSLDTKILNTANPLNTLEMSSNQIPFLNIIDWLFFSVGECFSCVGLGL